MIQKIFACAMMLNVITAPQVQIGPATRGMPALERAISAFAPDVAPGTDCATAGDWPKAINVKAVYRAKPGSNVHFGVTLKVCYDEKGLAWGTMRYLKDDGTERIYAHAGCVKPFEQQGLVVVAGPMVKKIGFSIVHQSKTWVVYEFDIARKTLRVLPLAPLSPTSCAALNPPDPKSFPAVFQEGELNLP